MIDFFRNAIVLFDVFKSIVLRRELIDLTRILNRFMIPKFVKNFKSRGIKEIN